MTLAQSGERDMSRATTAPSQYPMHPMEFGAGVLWQNSHHGFNISSSNQWTHRQRAKKRLTSGGFYVSRDD